MTLYSTLFSQMDVSVSQFLVTSYDFTDEGRKAHVRYSMERIIDHGMVPIVNENDALSGNQQYTEESVFSDNDALFQTRQPPQDANHFFHRVGVVLPLRCRQRGGSDGGRLVVVVWMWAVLHLRGQNRISYPPPFAPIFDVCL